MLKKFKKNSEKKKETPLESKVSQCITHTLVLENDNIYLKKQVIT
jgi:hypothetical protein